MSNELVEVSGVVDVPALGDETLIRLAEQAEKRVDALNKIKRAALKSTNRNDWVDQSGKPFLQSSGSEKIARIFGVSWKIDEPVFDREESGHFSVTYKGYFTVAGATIEAIGSRSSKDGFFKKYSYSGENRTELPPSEIDKTDVQKAAFSNLLGNGITRLLGIRNLTYEDLQEFAGITPEMIGRVDYKKGGKQDAPIASTEAKTVTGAVLDVRKKDGKSKAGKPFTKYTVKLESGDYATFSETYALRAKEAKDAGRTVGITYTTDTWGNNIEGLVFVDEAPGADVPETYPTREE